MIENKTCSICGSEDWEDLDHIRDQEYWYRRDFRLKDEKVGFKICKDCGYLTYDYLTPERLKESYDMQRKSMSSGNIITGNRKNEYHKAFLFDDDDFHQMYKTPSKRFLDVGCAQGSFLNLLEKNELACHNYYGTEWSEAFASFGRNEYGLYITNEIDESIKYDFISYYHVLEHIQWPEKELEKVRHILNKDGLLYLSVPIWDKVLDETSGGLTVDFENYYHVNHVNCFSRTSFHNLLKKTGFEIIKEDSVMYAYTVLCKMVDPIDEIIEEDYKDVIAKVEMEKQVIDLVNNDKPEEAIKIHPYYPDAYIKYALNAENMKSFNDQIEVLLEGYKNNPTNIKLLMQLGRCYLQYDENRPDKTHFFSNHVREAEKYFKIAEASKPGNEDIYYFLASIEAQYKRNYDKGVMYLKKQIDIDPNKFFTVYDLVSNFWREKDKLANGNG